MDSDEAVGKRVEKLRTDAGMSQEELSEKLREAGLNWSQGTLSRVETGARPMRFVEALTVASLLRVEVLDLTPSGGALTYVYHRRLQALDEHRWEMSRAKTSLHTAQMGVQLFKFAVELSQGSRRHYTLRIPPARFLGHIRYQMGVPSIKELLILLGAAEELIDGMTKLFDEDVKRGFDDPPPYAPPEFHAAKEAFPPAEPGTDDYEVQQDELRFLLEEGMLGEIFRMSFPNVNYDFPPLQSSAIFDWPNPVVEGIDTSDFDQPLRRPARVPGSRVVW